MSESRSAYKVYFNAPLSRNSAGISSGSLLIAKDYYCEVNFTEQSVTLRPGFEFNENAKSDKLHFVFPNSFCIFINKKYVVKIEKVKVPF